MTGKRKLLFVDHEFHIKTNSSEFFLDILRRHFIVDVVYVLPESKRDLDFGPISDVDCVVLWQIDYLAPMFLSRGLAVVAIPMYDGSGSLSDLHWICSLGARFINFSRFLHEKSGFWGGVAADQIFPSPCRVEDKVSFDGLNVFLWQRRPEDGINHQLVTQLFGDQLLSLHIHNHPDIDRGGSDQLPTRLPFGEIKVTNWFGYKADYIAALQQCNVFIAPRASEGIGLALLEAISLGMLVLANDQPTHNEYIRNWVNGVLFHKDSVSRTDFSRAASLGHRAWETVVEGHERWLLSEDAIIEFINKTPVPAVSSQRLQHRIARQLAPSFRGGREAYEKFLISLIRDMGPSDLIANPMKADGYVQTLPSRVHNEKGENVESTAHPRVVTMRYNRGEEEVEIVLTNGVKVEAPSSMIRNCLLNDSSFSPVHKLDTPVLAGASGLPKKSTDAPTTTQHQAVCKDELNSSTRKAETTKSPRKIHSTPLSGRRRVTSKLS